AAYAAGGEPQLPPVAVDYADFAVWQRDRAPDGELAYWLSRLDGAPPVLALPLDRPRPAVQSFRGDVVGSAVDAALTGRLRALGRASGATLFMVLLAA